MQQLVPVFRAYCSDNDDHILTTDHDEYIKITASGTWYRGEGIAFRTLSTQIPDSVPLVRLRNPDAKDQHMCTTRSSEIVQCIADGWVQEGTLGFVCQSDGPGRSALHRGLNPDTGAHLTTIDRNELLAAEYQPDEDLGYCFAEKLEWEFKYASIDYGKTTKGTQKRQTTGIVKSIGDGAGVTTFTLNGQEDCTFAWGLTQGMHFDVSNALQLTLGGDAKVGIPGVADVGGNASITTTTTISVGLTAGSHQDWSKSTTQGFEVSGTVNKPEAKEEDISMVVDWYSGLELDFVMSIYVSCKGPDGVQMTGAEVVELLKLLQSDLVVSDELGQTALMKMSGKFKGSFGIAAEVIYSDASSTPPTIDMASSKITYGAWD